MPTRMPEVRPKRARKTVEERFAEKQDRSGGPAACWPWLGFRNARGYGTFKIRSYRVEKAHRVAWEIANGRPIPDGMIARHLCHEPSCTNPRHVALGSTADNSRDMVEAGRSCRGERNGRARMTEAQALEVLARKRRRETTQAIADAMGLTVWSVQCVGRRSWRHLLAPSSEAA